MLDTERLYAEIGKRVRTIRESQTPRLSQGDLARILELKRTSVTNIESGRQKMTVDTLYRMCEYFGLDIGELMPPVGGFVQRGVVAAEDERAIVEMGGEDTASTDTRATEASVRGFWKAYRRHMEL